MSSIENKKLFAVLSSASGIITYILNVTGLLPQAWQGSIPVKITTVVLLIIGAILFFPVLHSFFKSKSRIWRISSYTFLGLVLIFAILGTLYQKPDTKPDTRETKIINNNMQVLQPVVKTGDNSHDHLIIGNNNHVGVNGDVTYVTKAPDRRITKNDLKSILSAIPDKDTYVRVNYPANDVEAAQFSDQIIDRLFQLGYTNTTKGEISNSSAYFRNERLTIKKDTIPVVAVNVIINPQQ